MSFINKKMIAILSLCLIAFVIIGISIGSKLKKDAAVSKEESKNVEVSMDTANQNEADAVTEEITGDVVEESNSEAEADVTATEDVEKSEDGVTDADNSETEEAEEVLLDPSDENYIWQKIAIRDAQKPLRQKKTAKVSVYLETSEGKVLDSVRIDEFDEEGFKVRDKRYDSEGEYRWYFIYSYDSNGNLISSKQYSPEGDFQFSIVYRYGDYHKIESYDSKNHWGEVLAKGVYSYSANGIKTYTFYREKEETDKADYIHNEDGLLVKVVNYSQPYEGHYTTDYIEDYEYDEEGRLIKVGRHPEENLELVHWKEYEYDEYNNVICLTAYNRQGIMTIEETEYEYY